jgi:type I restriction enzyme S subunit
MNNPEARQMKLHETVLIGGESIDPRRCPAEKFALFSIPAFDAGKKPEILNGNEIGSVKRTVLPGDCLFSKLNPRINRVWVVPDLKGYRQVATPEFWPLRPKPGVQMLPEFLCFVLSWDAIREAIIGREEAATKSRSRLKPEQLLSMSVPLPPLPEQRRIVRILDAAEGLRRLRAQADRRTADLIPALFHDMFGEGKWTASTGGARLVDVADGSDGIKCGPFGTQLNQSEFRAAGVPLWGIKHINRNFGIPTTEFLSCEKAAELSSYSLLPGDIVMTRKGTVGKCVIYPLGWDMGVMHSDLLRVRINGKHLVSEFLSALFMLSKDVERQISLVSSGAVMAGINVSRLKNIVIPIPPLALQVQFAARVQDFRALEARQAESRRRLGDLFQSLLHRAFQGEL